MANSFNNIGNRRIQYIDAIKGFTIILVVMTHVSRSICGENTDGLIFSDICQLFQMPLFYFISGFLFYKARTWDFNVFIEILSRKARTLLVPTILFGGIYVLLFNIPLYNALIDHGKAGYWFTIALFIFFFIFIISEILAKHIDTIFGNEKNKTEDIVTIIIALLITAVSFGNRVPSLPLHIPDNIYQAICGPQLWFYIYFVFGALVKKYFDVFQKVLDSNSLALLICLSIIGYIAYLKWQLDAFILAKAILRPLLGFGGLIIVFAFFRHHSDAVGSNKVGQALSFIGKRTLDIYLLHYFFLPSNIPALSSILANNPVFDIVCSLTFATIIVSFSLMIGKILRINQLLTNLIFGTKK